MKKHYKILIPILAILLIGCWALLAFFVAENLVQRFSLWANLVVGTATTIISILALYVSIISLMKSEESKKQKKIEDAKLFIHDHNDEIDYLPYCVYASCYDRHGHHTRKIYDDFCRLSDEMQKEVLMQANYDIPLIQEKTWIYQKINLIDKFAKEYGFGNTFLYDSGKHFLNGYKTKETPYIEEHIEELRDVFGMYNFSTRIFNKRGVTIDQYFESYGYRKFRDPKWLKRYNNYVAPGDVLIELKELRDPEKTSSDVVAFWMCHEIEDLYYIIEEYFYGEAPKGIIQNDAQPEYFEDKFYEILNLLYCMDDYSKYKLIIKEPYDKEEREKVENSDIDNN